MRKSTLITTIAMIVVVVVALSTATYAWFSSATQTVAATQVTTQANADWTVQKGALPNPVKSTANAITYSAAGSKVTMNNAMTNGLYSPTTAVASYLNSASATSVSILGSDLPGWYAAKTETGTDKHTVTDFFTNEEGAPRIKPTTGDATGFVMIPDILRVTRSKSGSATLQLNVVVSMGVSPTQATMYAAAATKFAICVTYENGDKKTFTNGYKYYDPANVAQDNKATFANRAAYAAENDDAKKIITVATSDLTTVASTDGITAPVYSADTQTANTGIFKFVGTPNDLEIACEMTTENTWYYLYTFDIGAVDFGKSVGCCVYTWLDGWAAEDAAAGASLNMYYSFQSA